MLTVITGRCGCGKTQRLFPAAGRQKRANAFSLLNKYLTATRADGRFGRLPFQLGGAEWTASPGGCGFAGGGRGFPFRRRRRMALRHPRRKDQLALFPAFGKDGFRARRRADRPKNADILPFDLKTPRGNWDGLLSGKPDLSVLYSGLLDFMAGNTSTGRTPPACCENGRS